MVKSNPKKDGSLRAVADLRKVNKCVVADSYAMPDTQELLDQLAESEWFTSIDLSSAFWQLPLAEESRDCTAFMTKTHGLLRWKALPMGFSRIHQPTFNAPSRQRLVAYVSPVVLCTLTT
jgi:hypothetical protein